MKLLSMRGGLTWVAAGVLLVYACGGDARRFVDPDAESGAGGEGASNTGGSSGTGTGGRGGSAGTGTSGDAGGPAGDGGTAGDGGAGGEGGSYEPPEPPPPGRPGTALVSGGMWMSSANYRLFSVTGQGVLPHNASSQNYRLHGGIVGTTQP